MPLAEAEDSDWAIEAVGVVDEDSPVVDSDEEMVEGVLHRGEKQSVGHSSFNNAFLLESKQANREELPFGECKGNWRSLVLCDEDLLNFLNSSDVTSSISTMCP